MTSSPLFNILLFFFLLGIDLYIWQSFRTVLRNKPKTLNITKFIYWGIALFTIAGIMYYNHYSDNLEKRHALSFLAVWGFIHYATKFSVLPISVLDDLRRISRHLIRLFYTPRFEKIEEKEEKIESRRIPRSEFLAKTGLFAGTLPLAGMTYAISSGAHDYRIRRVAVKLPALPAAFDGLKIAQISDIHSGSFFNKTAVRGGVDMLLTEKPDVAFFTGDLVNVAAWEMKDYFDIFKNVKAPLGTFSILGNHDYGTYTTWPSEKAKQENFQNLIKAHELLGWDLLRNENRSLRLGNEQIAIVGVENWSAFSRFPKHGRLDLAVQGTEEAPVKLLLSHDPSHWEAEVVRDYPDIDLMFSGHTHGMQFGIEIGKLKWSPVQYIYKQWAGLYEQEHQKLYVNRGYGYLGFPGRIGILPEITIMELKKG